VARDEYLDHLKTVPLFSRCDKAQLREIGKVADELTVKAGTVLMREGQIGRELFLIIEGTADVARDSQVVATIGPGDFVGELSVIAHVARNATVTARTDLDVLVMTSSALSQLLDDIPGLAKHLLYEVAQRLAPSPLDHRS
jgi:CRP/FNR family transcriptional regulator, cyclic AMP receptor protein